MLESVRLTEVEQGEAKGSLGFHGVKLRKVPVKAMKHRADVYNSGFSFETSKCNAGPLQFYFFMPREASIATYMSNKWPLIIYWHGSGSGPAFVEHRDEEGRKPPFLDQRDHEQ
jgi:hypothetical protein